MSRSIVNNDESENANNPPTTGDVIQMVDAREANRQTRRQAILSGLAGLVAGGLAGLGWLKWPTAVTWAGDVTPQQAHERTLAATRSQSGAATATANERQRITGELLTQGGVTLDHAKQAATETATSVTSLVVPLAQVTVPLSSDGSQALQQLINSVTSAQLILKQNGVSIANLETIRQLFLTWQGNLSQLPINLNAYADAATSSHFPDAQTYLTALETAVNGKTL